MGGSVGPTDSDDAERVRDLEARLGVVERELARSRTLLHEAATERQTQAAELKSSRRELDSLRARRSVRMALSVSGIGRRLATALRSVRGGGRRSGSDAAKVGAARDQGRDEAADAVDPRRFREGFLASVDSGGTASRALQVALLGDEPVADLDAALTSLGWRVSRSRASRTAAAPISIRAATS